MVLNCPKTDIMNRPCRRLVGLCILRSDAKEEAVFAEEIVDGNRGC